MFHVLLTIERTYSFRVKFIDYLRDSLRKHGDFKNNELSLQFYANGVLGLVNTMIDNRIETNVNDVAIEINKLVPIVFLD